ncbi:MAG: UDP-3-O-[Abditibacteriota bacterium]|nr:UDP-3-O-[3-hydroxymyristoyl] N-acetylglucosamine deacetylase [Abditibacteriota bacterium]
MTTIDKTVVLEGVGLHTGVCSKATLMPYDKEGLFFKFGDEIIKATADMVCDTSRCTMLNLKGHIVQTCEHMLSSIYALGINSVLIELSAEETPIFDGSGVVWFETLKDHITGEPIKPVTIPAPIEITDKDAYIKAYPSGTFEIEYFLDYAHPQIGKTSFLYTPEKFEKYIAPSRTFALFEEVEFLRANGLAKGGSEENCIVVYKDHISSPLRHKEEFATHKILDLIGDISLCGVPLLIKIKANKSGHKLNNMFARELRMLLT